MKKVVVNARYGGFGLSEKAIKRYMEISGKVVPSWTANGYTSWEHRKIPRHDPALVQVVEELGEEANGEFADLKVVRIPGIKYLIADHDGYEDVYYPELEHWIVIE